ncbi:MAG: YihY/virulence factor BrkB family protein [Isosphaeraceae bacterium]
MSGFTHATGPGFFGGLTPLQLARRTWAQASENQLTVHASAAAYYALTALVPFIGLLVTLAAHLVPDITGGSGETGPGGMTVEEFRLMLSRQLPDEAYQVVAREIARIQKQPPVGLLSVGLVVTLWLSSSISGTIIEASNRILGLPETRPYWWLVVRSAGLTLVEAVIILGSMFLLAVWPELRGPHGWGPAGGLVGTLVEWLVVTVGTLLSFSVAAKFGPNIRRPWAFVTPGSLIGTVALISSTLLLRLYIRSFGNYDKTYGSLAGVMLLALFFWVAAMILLLAVQVDKVIEDGKGMQP